MTQPRRGRPPTPIDPDASHAARLGFEIRKARQTRGLTLTELAGLIGFSPQQISGVELAKTLVSGAFVTACDRALEADGALLALLPAVLGEQTMQRHERAAARQRSAGREVPAYADVKTIARAFGLERYAELLYPSEADEDVDLSRRDLIGAGVGATLGLANMPAPAAAREIDPALASHWVDLLSVLDYHDAMFGSHAVLEIIRHEVTLMDQCAQVARGELRTELLRVQARWSGFASWLSHDAGDSRAIRALRLAKEAEYQDLIAWILMRQSEWAATRLQPRQAIAFADAASRIPDIKGQIRAVCALRKAYGHALGKDAVSCERSLAETRATLLDHAGSSEEASRPELGGHTVTPPYVLADEARCWAWLDAPKAVAMYEDAFRLWPRDRTRSRGIHQARLAVACEAANEPDRAAAEGLKALDIAQTTKSDTIMRELKRLDRRLVGRSHAAAAEFRDAFAAS
jgi:transcriptional regulator with XRE-family HTH domain